jgi:hypothetical protein
MARNWPLKFRLSRAPRFVSFDAGVVAALLGLGLYMALVKGYWIAAIFLTLGMLWMISIPIRLRVRKSKGH